MNGPQEVCCDTCDAICTVELAMYIETRDGREVYKCTFHCKKCGEKTVTVKTEPGHTF
jgi:hypothetical protein